MNERGERVLKKILCVIVIFNSGFALAQPRYIPGVSCSSFPTQQSAQAYFNYWVKGIGKPKSEKRINGKGLDRDKDGYACDCNPGSRFYGTKRCNKRK
jgi:Excalibur calcium-binding domain